MDASRPTDDRTAPRLPAPRPGRRPHLRLWIAHIGLSLAAIVLLAWRYTDSSREALHLVPFHLLVAVPLWVAVFSAAGLLATVRQSGAGRWLRGAALAGAALCAAAAVVLYLADVVGNGYWGSNVSDRMAYEFVRHFDEFRTALLPAWGWGLLVAALGGAVWGHMRAFGPAIVDWGERLRTWMSPVPGRAAWRRAAGTAALAATVTGYGTGLTAFWDARVVPLRLWRREPLTSFVVMSRPHLIPENVRAILFPPTAERRQEAARDAQARSSYPKRRRSVRNVIMFLVDCLRADHLPFFGYRRNTTPFLSRLEAEGRIHAAQQARAACNCTPCGVMSALASRPQERLGRGLFMLQDALHDQGYRTHFILSGWHDVWYDLRALYGGSIDYYYEGTQTTRYLPDDDLLLLEGLEPVPPASGQPGFFYFHLMSAHDTGVYGPEFARWQPSLGLQLGGMFTLRGNDPVTSANTYDNKLLKADHVIERLLGELDRKGYLEDALVVVLGDHGQGLGEHDHYSHGRRLYDEDLRIPILFIDDPAVSYEGLASALQVDVAPTILDRLGLPVPATWTGRSLLGPSAPPAFTTHYGCMGGNNAAVFTEGGIAWKFISGPREGDELYDLQSDRGETENLAGQPRGAAALARGRAILASRLRPPSP